MIAKDDWVIAKNHVGIGLVQRVSTKGGWAEVAWPDQKNKRVRLVDLRVITIIDVNPTEPPMKKASQC